MEGNPFVSFSLMNNKNALGFLVLGLLMYVTPMMAQSLAVHPEVISDTSVRMIWLELMGWVIGGIGSSYLMKEAAIRMPVLFVLLTPERLLRPIEDRVDSARLPAAVRAGVSS